MFRPLWKTGTLFLFALSLALLLTIAGTALQVPVAKMNYEIDTLLPVRIRILARFSGQQKALDCSKQGEKNLFYGNFILDLRVLAGPAL